MINSLLRLLGDSNLEELQNRLYAGLENLKKTFGAAFTSLEDKGEYYELVLDVADVLGGLVVHKGFAVVKDDGGIQAEALQLAEHLRSGGVAVGRLLLHRLHGDLLETDRDAGVDLTGTLGGGLKLHERDRDGAVAVKGQSAREHLIEHDADGIDVGLAVGDVSSRLLGRDVVNRADRLVGHGARRLVGKARDAEVGHLDGAVLQQHDVLRLDVAVNDAALMRVLQRLEDLGGEVQHVLPLDDTLTVDILLESDAVDIFHDDILDHIAEADIIDLDDVRMRKHRDRLGFVLEAADEFLIVEVLVLEDFDSDLAVVDGVVAAVDICHAADADQLVNFIASVQTLADILVHLTQAPFSVNDGDRDIVGTAAFLGTADELVDETVAAVLVANLDHIARGDMVGETVCANQQNVAVDKIGFYVIEPHAGLDAESTGDEILVGMMLRLLIGQLAASHHLLHHGMILRELLDFAAAYRVGAAVADVYHVNGGVLDKDKLAGRSHSRKLGILRLQLKHPEVGVHNDFRHQLANLLLCHVVLIEVGDLGADILHSGGACDIAAVGASHAVTYDRPHAAWRNNSEAKIILVLCAHKTDVTLAEYFQAIRPPS